MKDTNAKGFPDSSAFLPVPDYLLAFLLDDTSERGKAPPRGQQCKGKCGSMLSFLTAPK